MGKDFGPRFVSSSPPKSSESGAAGTHGEEAPALWRTQGVGSRALRPVPARLCVSVGGHNEVGCTRGPEAATGAGCGTLRVTVVGGGVRYEGVGFETALQKTVLLLLSVVDEAFNSVTRQEFGSQGRASFLLFWA